MSSEYNFRMLIYSEPEMGLQGMTYSKLNLLGGS